MELEPNRCYALTRNKTPKRCSFKNQANLNCIYCKKHQKMKNVVRYDKIQNKEKNQDIEETIFTFKNSYSKKKLIELCNSYNLDTTGKKELILERLLNLKQKIKPYKNQIPEIKKIQFWYSDKKKDISKNYMEKKTYKILI